MSAAHVLLDNTLLPATAACIPATCEGFLYGHGIFETIKVLNSRPVFLAHHHVRLTASCRALDLAYADDLETLHERLQRVITANALTDGFAKIVLFARDPTPGELITTRPGLYPADTYARGFHLRTVFTGERTGAISGHKTINYLANIRAKRAALAEGFDESLFLTPAGIVIEGATTNVFVVRHGVALTPPSACGPLPGIARGRVLALLGPDRAREALLTRADLEHAEEIFVTNARLGVMPVSRLDERRLDLEHTPVTRALAHVYRAAELQSLL